MELEPTAAGGEFQRSRAPEEQQGEPLPPRFGNPSTATGNRAQVKRRKAATQPQPLTKDLHNAPDAVPAKRRKLPGAGGTNEWAAVSAGASPLKSNVAHNADGLGVLKCPGKENAVPWASDCGPSGPKVPAPLQGSQLTGVRRRADGPLQQFHAFPSPDVSLAPGGAARQLRLQHSKGAAAPACAKRLRLSRAEADAPSPALESGSAPDQAAAPTARVLQTAHPQAMSTSAATSLMSPSDVAKLPPAVVVSSIAVPGQVLTTPMAALQQLGLASPAVRLQHITAGSVRAAADEQAALVGIQGVAAASRALADFHTHIHSRGPIPERSSASAKPAAPLAGPAAAGEVTAAPHAAGKFRAADVSAVKAALQSIPGLNAVSQGQASALPAPNQLRSYQASPSSHALSILPTFTGIGGSAAGGRLRLSGGAGAEAFVRGFATGKQVAGRPNPRAGDQEKAPAATQAAATCAADSAVAYGAAPQMITDSNLHAPLLSHPPAATAARRLAGATTIQPPATLNSLSSASIINYSAHGRFSELPSRANGTRGAGTAAGPAHRAATDKGAAGGAAGACPVLSSNPSQFKPLSPIAALVNMSGPPAGAVTAAAGTSHAPGPLLGRGGCNEMPQGPSNAAALCFDAPEMAAMGAAAGDCSSPLPIGRGCRTKVPAAKAKGRGGPRPRKDALKVNAAGVSKPGVVKTRGRATQAPEGAKPLPLAEPTAAVTAAQGGAADMVKCMAAAVVALSDNAAAGVGSGRSAAVANKTQAAKEAVMKKR